MITEQSQPENGLYKPRHKLLLKLLDQTKQNSSKCLQANSAQRPLDPRLLPLLVLLETSTK